MRTLSRKVNSKILTLLQWETSLPVLYTFACFKLKTSVPVERQENNLKIRKRKKNNNIEEFRYNKMHLLLKYVI